MRRDPTDAEVLYTIDVPLGLHAGLYPFSSVGTVISFAPSLSTIRTAGSAHVRDARRGDAALPSHPSLDLVGCAMHAQAPITTQARRRAAASRRRSRPAPSPTSCSATCRPVATAVIWTTAAAPMRAKTG